MNPIAPETVVLPTICTGGTDAKVLTSLGTTVYGFFPMRYEPGVMDLAHAHDERISTRDIRFGDRALYEIVHKFAVGCN